MLIQIISMFIIFEISVIIGPVVIPSCVQSKHVFSVLNKYGWIVNNIRYTYACIVHSTRSFSPDLLTLFYTCGLQIVVLHVMVPQQYRFSLYFLAYYFAVLLFKVSAWLSNHAVRNIGFITFYRPKECCIFMMKEDSCKPSWMFYRPKECCIFMMKEESCKPSWTFYRPKECCIFMMKEDSCKPSWIIYRP